MRREREMPGKDGGERICCRGGCKGRTGKEERVIKEDTEGRQRSKTVKAETLTESN